MKKFIPYPLLVALFSLLLITGCKDEGCDLEPNLTVDQAQLATEIAAIDAFLEQNNIVAQNHPSGLRYVINEEGTGANADFCSTVTVTFIGSLFNGEVFDSTGPDLDTGTPARFPLSDLITGWEVGIPLVKEGGTITLYIPSVYGFGTTALPGIPALSNLIFEIKVLSVD